MKKVAILLMLLPLGAFATPGNVDKNGCHHSKREGFHCHPERVGRASNSQTFTAPTKTVKTESAKHKKSSR